MNDLSDINISKIFSLTEAKKILRQLLNKLEDCFSLIAKKDKEIEELKQKLAQATKQSKKPTFPSSKSGKKKNGLTRMFRSVTALLGEHTQDIDMDINKKSKGDLPIDDHKTIKKDKCDCGGKLTTTRTDIRIIQGIRFERHNVAYHVTDQKCISCGKEYQGQMPEGLRNTSFDPGLCSFISFLKFGCRMTYPLIHRMLTGIGIQISYGQINKIILKNGDILASVHRYLKTIGFKLSLYFQSDASGAKRYIRRIKKVRSQYVQLIRNDFISVFFITKKYNAKTLKRLLGKTGLSKIFVSDDGSPNGECLMCKGKQLCWVHEIRHVRQVSAVY
jgi:hypothetical protein